MTRALPRGEGITVTLNYPRREAQAMRAFVESIRLKGDRKPSLSLIARRSVGLYLEHMQRAQRSSPSEFLSELSTLERMVTPIPKPRPKSRRVTP